MNKRITSIIVLVIIIVLLLVVGILAIRLFSQTREAPQPQIATDANFPEVVGGLIEGFPQVPVYPGATLKGSAKANTESEPDKGYRAIWESHDDIKTIMAWYESELTAAGWEYSPPDDAEAAEQIAQISKGNLKGYVAAEVEGSNEVEIVISLQIIN